MEHTVIITGRRGKELVTASIKTKAESPQMAILQVSGINAKGICWYSYTYRQELGYVDDVTIFKYKV